MFNADIQRLILLGALGLVLVMLWQSWTAFQRDYHNPATAQSARAQNNAAPAAASSNARSNTPSDVPAAPAIAAAQSPEPQSDNAIAPRGRIITVTTDLVRAEIDARGGDLIRLELLRHPVSVDSPDQPFVLMHRDNTGLSVAQGGLIGANSRVYPDHTVDYAPAQLHYDLGDQMQVEIPLTWTAPDGVAYQKVFRFARDSYRIDIDYRIANHSAQAWDGFVYGQLKQTEIARNASFFQPERLTFHGAAVYTAEDKYDKISYADMRETNLNRATESGWVAMMRHYFVAAWLPRGAEQYQFYSQTSGANADRQYRIGYKTARPAHVAPGASGVINTSLYVGPKEQKRLARQDAEGLLLTVDYGWMTPIADPLFWLLNKIHGAVNNWGVAIVLLTLLVKAVFYPLSAASYKSMAKMKKLGPRLKTLKERYGDDKQKFQQEMMKLYKTEKVNPAGGCLPVLVQIPVFIALYWTLLESVELRQADFMLWIKDLSVPDPYFVLPIIMGGSMLAQFFLNPAPVDPLQKKVMMAMPIVFTALFLWMPSGLVLYWVTNNLLSIAQQYYITRKYETARAK